MPCTPILSVLSLFVLFAIVEGQSLWSVLYDGSNWSVSEGQVENYIALAQVQTDNNITGWATLEIVTNGVSQDSEQAYAAGYIEGALTTDLIHNSWMSNIEYFFNGEMNVEALAWIQKNDDWVRSQVNSCQGYETTTAEYGSNDCDYWGQVGLVLNQFDGLVHGYNDNCGDDKAISYDEFLYLNAGSDIGDILVKLNITQAPKTPLEAMLNDHCSVLIKYSSETQELYHSHTTWGHYVNALRVFKHYTFKFNHPSTQSKTVSFSSFPGFLSSGDDYFITDRGLIVTETTNNVFNMSLYEFVQPATVLYWLRVIVSNRMSDTAPQWAQTFAKYNSGTYNNQWQITDTKLFSAGQSVFKPDTLWILEQIPGYCVSADVTNFLVDQSYFPSYNIPYFEFVYNISGYPEMYESHGDAFSYNSCPRANIFRRDQDKITTFAEYQDMMRYNEYQTDPLSLGNSCNGISARCDLNTTLLDPFGAYDCKATSTKLITSMTTAALSGPTTLTQPPFSWTGRFADIPHYGQPTEFNFTFENMQPTLSK